MKGYNKEVIESSLELSQGDIGLAETICNDVSIIDNNNNNNNNNMNRNIERIIIDADNSCLFNSVSYCLCNNKKLAKSFRQLIVNEIKNEKDIYTDDMLGKDVNEYCNWILKDNSWGGEIELNIFSKVLGITINAIEIESNNIYKYENDTNDNCIYLLYDGIHYDSIACSNNMMTIFNKNDTNMINSLKDFAANLKQKREFVNINSKSFEIRCLVCSEVFKGQKEAVSHAQLTGHQNFSQG
jgi:ubiquitin thioesterase OTU1